MIIRLVDVSNFLILKFFVVLEFYYNYYCDEKAFFFFGNIHIRFTMRISVGRWCIKYKYEIYSAIWLEHLSIGVASRDYSQHIFHVCAPVFHRSPSAFCLFPLPAPRCPNDDYVSRMNVHIVNPPSAWLHTQYFKKATQSENLYL